MEDMNAPAPAEPIDVSPAIEAPEAPTPPEPAAEPTIDAPKEMPTRQDALKKAFEAVDGDKPEPTVGEDGRLRGPDGKFAAKDATEAAPEGEGAEPAADAPKTAKAPVSDAPSRFSPDAKAAWADAPESVRGEINRAISELETGLQQKDSQLAPLKQYFDMAEQHGVTVHDTMARYVQMEKTLAQDLPRGMQMLAQNFGMTLPDLIAKVSGEPQAQGDIQTIQRENLGLRQEIADMRAQIGNVNQTVQQQQESQIMQTVEAFAANHPRFDELSEAIKYELQASQALGQPMSLEDAYAKAERLNPAPQPAAPAAPAAQAQPRVSRSVTGAPTSGSNPAPRQPSATRTDALARAFSQVGI